MLRVLFCLFILLLPARAWAQGSYTNTTAAAINAGTDCNNSVTRNIVVVDSFTLADVDLGLLIPHTWRGDVRLDLVSPAGTSVRLINADTANTGNRDNYNIVLDDEAGTLINTAPHDTADGTVAPPYENRVRPNNALSAFDGQGSNGTWQIRMCDAFPGADDGTFQNADLRLTPVAAPPAPTLTCTTGAPLQLAWTAPGGAFGWPAGSIATQSYTASGNPISVSLAGNTNRFVPRNGTATPVTSTDTSGGTGQFGLLSHANFANGNEEVVYTFNLGDPGVGLAGLQFDIFDVDQQTGAWQDRFQVEASLSGAPVPVTLTPTNGANYVNNSSIIGLRQIQSQGPGGEGTITVAQPLDQLTITYRAGPRSPADPNNQVMSYSLIDFCPPAAPDLAASKSVAVVGGGFALPGSELSYVISVTNAGSATASAQDIDIVDTLPDDLDFVSASLSGFTGGTFDPALPAANTSCAAGACVVSLDGASLGVGDTGAITVIARLR